MIRPAPVPERPAERVDWSAIEAAGGIPKPGKAKHARKFDGIPRRSEIARGKRLAPIGRDRERVKAEQDGPQAQAAREQVACSCCGGAPTRWNPMEAHHEPPLSQGGTDEDAVNLLRRCHERRTNSNAVAFWTRARMHPDDVKLALRAWMQAGCPRASLPWGAR